MTDPVAEAAAKIEAEQKTAEPTILERLEEGVHDLAEKVEHLMHPDAPAVAQPGEAGVAAGVVATPAGSDASAATADAAPSSTEPAPNAAPAAEEQPAMPPSAPPASTPTGTANSVASSAASAIKGHIAAVKHHLSIRGFEQSVVADIHTELDAIEKWL
jgi:hypothetical protein